MIINYFKYNKNKGYNKLIETRNLYLIRKIKIECGEVRLDKIKNDFNFDFELAVRQFYTNFFLGSAFEEKILFSIGSGRSIKFFPIHKSYQKVLDKNKINFSPFFTNLFFWLVMCLFLVYGFLFFIKVLMLKIKPFKQPFIYFNQLSINNLPKQNSEKEDHNVVSWYLNKFKPKEKNIYHNANQYSNNVYKNYNLLFAKSFLPPIKNKFLFWINGSKLILKSLFLLFSGKWEYSLLLKELIVYKIFSQCDISQIGSKYFFYNSYTFHRPLWTYFAEKRGAEVISYFYSCSDRIQNNNFNEKNSDFISLMNWPILFVWDSYQKELFYSNLIHKSIINIVGPIPFLSGNIKMPIKQKRKRVVIFDTPPFNPGLVFICSTAKEMGLHLPQVHIDFFNDIILASKMLDLELSFKSKRKDSRENIDYLEYINLRVKKGDLIEIDPECSAFDAILESDFVISFPFTSTSVISKFLGIESIYYDPTNSLNKTDPSAHGIRVLSDIVELENLLINSTQS